MGEQSARIGLKAAARFGAPILFALVLANCADGNRVRNLSYSPKVVVDGEPIPKGGGTYKIGNPYIVNGRTYVPMHDPGYRSEGIASWYGPDFHGRRTANGEVFDMNAISAAHPTMPLPSYARVTNLENGRSIIVRVNDRGPYARDRVIDLSIGAARALGTFGRGLARVRVEYVGRAPLTGSDDQTLLASLRHGAPAVAPSRVRVAAQHKPLAVRPEPPRGRHPPVVRTPPDYSTVMTDPAISPAERASALGLMSGRGLY